MARPKSDDKRKAIMRAAIRVIVTQGLSAPTAAIAKEAGVANGSLFTYFETKTALLNALYLDLKEDMASAALADLEPGMGLREEFLHAWTNWMRWASASPDKRRALALLGVSDEITPQSRAAGHETMAGIASLMQRGRAHGAMRDAPMAFVAELMNAMADATMDFMLSDSAHAELHSRTGFEALWRVLT